MQVRSHRITQPQDSAFTIQKPGRGHLEPLLSAAFSCGQGGTVTVPYPGEELHRVPLGLFTFPPCSLGLGFLIAMKNI